VGSCSLISQKNIKSPITTPMGGKTTPSKLAALKNDPQKQTPNKNSSKSQKQSLLNFKSKMSPHQSELEGERK